MKNTNKSPVYDSYNNIYKEWVNTDPNYKSAWVNIGRYFMRLFS